MKYAVRHLVSNKPKTYRYWHSADFWASPEHCGETSIWDENKEFALAKLHRARGIYPEYASEIKLVNDSKISKSIDQLPRPKGRGLTRRF